MGLDHARLADIAFVIKAFASSCGAGRVSWSELADLPK